MTLDEFQIRIRAIFDGHIASVAAANATLVEALGALEADIISLRDRGPAVDAILTAEVKRAEAALSKAP
jgi:hypothetical protein